MLAYCTYCSALKNETEGTLKAIDRYQSDRIQTVFDLATYDRRSFYILSGKFGLLEEDAPTPYYDHLLARNEISRHAFLVAEHLRTHKITGIRFFVRNSEADSNIQRYITCIQEACEMTGIPFELALFAEGAA